MQDQKDWQGRADSRQNERCLTTAKSYSTHYCRAEKSICTQGDCWHSIHHSEDIIGLKAPILCLWWLSWSDQPAARSCQRALCAHLAHISIPICSIKAESVEEHTPQVSTAHPQSQLHGNSLRRRFIWAIIVEPPCCRACASDFRSSPVSPLDAWSTRLCRVQVHTISTKLLQLTGALKRDYERKHTQSAHVSLPTTCGLGT